MRRRLEVDDDKRWVLLAAAPGSGAHVAVECGVPLLLAILVDSLELSGFEVKCFKGFKAIYKGGSHLTSSQGFGGSFRFLFGGACTH